MKANQVRALPEIPKQMTVCENCHNPCTYIYGYVKNGRGAVCSRFCDEQYRRKQNETGNVSEVQLGNG